MGRFGRHAGPVRGVGRGVPVADRNTDFARESRADMGVTRRRVLRTGVAVTATAGLAGCAGGPVGDDDPPTAADYREQLLEELAITIERLAVVDGRVVLEYTSDYETDTERLGYEIGFVSGRFANLVGNGWDVEGLVATVTTADDARLTWRIDRETARAFAADEITVDEFLTRIFDSMTVE